MDFYCSNTIQTRQIRPLVNDGVICVGLCLFVSCGAIFDPQYMAFFVAGISLVAVQVSNFDNIKFRKKVSQPLFSPLCSYFSIPWYLDSRDWYSYVWLKIIHYLTCGTLPNHYPPCVRTIPAFSVHNPRKMKQLIPLLCFDVNLFESSSPPQQPWKSSSPDSNTVPLLLLHLIVFLIQMQNPFPVQNRFLMLDPPDHLIINICHLHPKETFFQLTCKRVTLLFPNPISLYSPDTSNWSGDNV